MIFSPRVSIIIPTHNRPLELQKCLRSIISSQETNFEIILVDNASNSETLKIIKRFQDEDSRIQVILNSRNLGPVAARNQAIHLAKGELISFLDSDVIVHPNWLSEPLKVFESDEKVAAIQCNVITIDGYFQNGWFGKELIMGRRPERTKITEISAVMGPAYFVRKEVLKKMGNKPFDEWYFKYYEEADISWKINALGHKIIFCPSSVVVHLKKLMSHKGRELIIHQEKNLLATVYKYYTRFDLVTTTTKIVAYHVARIIAQPIYAFSILAAYHQLLRHIRGVWIDRYRYRPLIEKVSKQRYKDICSLTFDFTLLYRLWNRKFLESLRIDRVKDTFICEFMSQLNPSLHKYERVPY